MGVDNSAAMALEEAVWSATPAELPTDEVRLMGGDWGQPGQQPECGYVSPVPGTMDDDQMYSDVLEDTARTFTPSMTVIGSMIFGIRSIATVLLLIFTRVKILFCGGCKGIEPASWPSLARAPAAVSSAVPAAQPSVNIPAGYGLHIVGPLYTYRPTVIFFHLL